MNVVDTSGSGITWKRTKTAPGDTEDSNKCREEGGGGGSEKGLCYDSLQFSAVPRSRRRGSYVLPLLPVLEVEESGSNAPAVFTGAACRGKNGPPVGSVDIGVSKTAYYFCISLPGVRKDPGKFSCSVQEDGKVCVQGVTSTGGKVVKKYSRVFEMKIQQLCPPGPFTLFFNLPGAVDPKLFSPKFRTDGIFEAVVAKSK